MIAQDGFYSGLVAPRWNEIDKIHYGPASTLNPNDEIFLGRYVLVQYTKEALGQDDKNRIIASGGNLNKDIEIEWYECYTEDIKNFSYNQDGVVFKKIVDESGKLIYAPVAQLSTTYTSALEPSEIQQMVDNAVANTNITPRIQWKGF